MRIVAGEARQVNLSSTITASGSQATLAAVPTTMAVPAGGTLITYAGELTAPAGSAAALDDATIRNPTFTPDVPGLYTVAITATDTVSGATLTLVRTQEVASELSISLTADSSQDALDAVPTTTTPTGGLGLITYSTALELPDRTSGSVSGGATTTPSFTPTIPGLYVLTVTATDAAGQTARASRSVLVGTAAFTISLSATSGTQDNLNAVSTTVTPSGAVGTVTYSAALSKPSTSSSSVSGGTTTTPSFTPDKVGGYTLVVTATDAAGREAKATRYLQVGTSTFSVSIAAISDQAGQTGTITCDSTVSNALGSVTYAWSGEKPDGTAITFSDATAADPTITLSASDIPGNYTVRVVVTDAARVQTASSVTYCRVCDVTTNAARCIYATVTGGAWSWKEQVLIGGVWVDISAYATMTTETDGTLGLSGTTLTIPIGIGTSTAPTGCPDERYVAFSSASATFQALIATGAQWIVTSGETSMQSTLNARWGWGLYTGSGNYDGTTKNIIGVRMGHNGTAYALDSAPTNTSYTEVATAAAVGVRKHSAAMETATSGSWRWDAASDKGAFSPGTGVMSRLYVTACAKTAVTLATTDVVAPWVRLTIMPTAGLS